jgi:DNA polymerase-1
VGEKTAAKWIAEFGSLDALVERVDEVKGKAGDALRAHLAQVIQNRMLTELVRDVPIDTQPGDLVLAQWDRDAVHALFDTLEFQVLRERLYQTLQAVEPEADEGFEVSGRVLDPGDVAGWLAEHASGTGRTGVHIVGSWARGTGDVHGVALAAADGTAAFFDPTAMTPEDEQAFAGWLADPEHCKALHDSKGPSHAFASRAGTSRASPATPSCPPTSPCPVSARSTSPT